MAPMKSLDVTFTHNGKAFAADPARLMEFVFDTGMACKT